MYSVLRTLVRVLTCTGTVLVKVLAQYSYRGKGLGASIHVSGLSDRWPFRLVAYLGRDRKRTEGKLQLGWIVSTARIGGKRIEPWYHTETEFLACTEYLKLVSILQCALVLVLTYILYM